MGIKTFFAELGAVFGIGGGFETIDRAAVKAGLADGSIALVDVREPAEFKTAHVAGAINLPLSSFAPEALPADGRTVVLMCRSGARARLACLRAGTRGGRKGMQIYQGSMQDWAKAGEPVASGAA